MICTNYFVKYLHYDNNGVLDGFIDHNNNMSIVNNKYDTRKLICDTLYKKYKTHDFQWSNQSYTAIATSLSNRCAVICWSHSIIIRQDKCEKIFTQKHCNGVVQIDSHKIWKILISRNATHQYWSIIRC